MAVFPHGIDVKIVASENGFGKPLATMAGEQKG